MVFQMHFDIDTFVVSCAKKVDVSQFFTEERREKIWECAHTSQVQRSHIHIYLHVFSLYLFFGGDGFETEFLCVALEAVLELAL